MKDKDIKAITKLYVESNWEHEPYTSDYNDQRTHEKEIDSEDEDSSDLVKLSREIDYPLKALQSLIQIVSNSEELKSVADNEDNFIGLYRSPLRYDEFSDLVKQAYKHFNEKGRWAENKVPKVSVLADWVIKYAIWHIEANNPDESWA